MKTRKKNITNDTHLVDKSFLSKEHQRRDRNKKSKSNSNISSIRRPVKKFCKKPQGARPATSFESQSSVLTEKQKNEKKLIWKDSDKPIRKIQTEHKSNLSETPASILLKIFMPDSSSSSSSSSCSSSSSSSQSNAPCTSLKEILFCEPPVSTTQAASYYTGSPAVNRKTRKQKTPRKNATIIADCYASTFSDSESEKTSDSNDPFTLLHNSSTKKYRKTSLKKLRRMQYPCSDKHHGESIKKKDSRVQRTKTKHKSSLPTFVTFPIVRRSRRQENNINNQLILNRTVSTISESSSGSYSSDSDSNSSASTSSAEFDQMKVKYKPQLKVCTSGTFSSQRKKITTKRNDPSNLLSEGKHKLNHIKHEIKSRESADRNVSIQPHKKNDNDNQASPIKQSIDDEQRQPTDQRRDTAVIPQRKSNSTLLPSAKNAKLLKSEREHVQSRKTSSTKKSSHKKSAKSNISVREKKVQQASSLSKSTEVAPTLSLISHGVGGISMKPNLMPNQKIKKPKPVPLPINNTKKVKQRKQRQTDRGKDKNSSEKTHMPLLQVSLSPGKHEFTHKNRMRQKQLKKNLRGISHTRHDNNKQTNVLSLAKSEKKCQKFTKTKQNSINDLVYDLIHDYKTQKNLVSSKPILEDITRQTLSVEKEKMKLLKGEHVLEKIAPPLRRTPVSSPISNIKIESSCLEHKSSMDEESPENKEAWLLHSSEIFPKNLEAVATYTQVWSDTPIENLRRLESSNALNHTKPTFIDFLPRVISFPAPSMTLSRSVSNISQTYHCRDSHHQSTKVLDEVEFILTKSIHSLPDQTLPDVNAGLERSVQLLHEIRSKTVQHNQSDDHSEVKQLQVENNNLKLALKKMVAEESIKGRFGI